MPGDGPVDNPPIFDGHLDLAYLAEIGRDMHAPASGCRGPLLPASVTLPSLAAGNVRACLGTIFTEPSEPAGVGPGPGAGLGSGLVASSGAGAYTYPPGDADAAHRAGLRQLKLYHAWRDAGVIGLLPDPGDAPLAVGVLMEGADPIRSADEVAWWGGQGVVAIGLAWARGSRYAGGNAQGDGLSPAGRDMVRAIDEAGLVHDLSHLSDRAMDELLGASDGRVIASHSNARALLGGSSGGEDPGGKDQRHLRDGCIAEIARRGGVVGVNLHAPFLDPAFTRGGERPPLRAALEHVLRIADVGGKRSVALGTDMDGGFDATCLPEGVNTPAGLRALLDMLAAEGWTQAEVADFAGGTWARFFGLGWGPDGPGPGAAKG